MFFTTFVCVCLVATVGYMLFLRPTFTKPQALTDDSGIIPAISKQDHVLWDGNPAITIVNYYDFDCPHCKLLFFRELDEPENIKKEIRLIYRPFPLRQLFPRSLGRMIIAECVAAQTNDKIFFSFLEAGWRAYQPKSTDDIWLMKIAEGFVPNQSALHSCSQNQEPLARINNIRAGALVRGIFSTPSFLVQKQNQPLKRYDLLGEGTGSGLLEAFAQQML